MVFAGEDVLEAVVVADGGEDGAVGGEGDGAEGGAVDGEADDELGDDVLGICGRAAVAADEQLAAVAHGVSRRGGGVQQGTVNCVVVEDFCQGVERLL